MPTKDPETGTHPSLPPEQPSAGAASVPLAGDASLERFAKSFEASARRWELVVYPSLFAFIILAAYGFFLIYSLTRDMHIMAAAIDPTMEPHMNMMARSVQHLSESVESMTTRVHEMADKISTMDATVTRMSGHIAVMQTDMGEMSRKMNTLEPMLVNMSEMNQSIGTLNQSVLAMNQSVQAMTVNTGTMSRDMAVGTYHFVRPMSFMNSFFPW
ncbi:MAG: hypothetical protein WAN46_20620 [Gammaproteobacteria bacterium]|jgi:uncharacterized protein YoxC